MFNKQSTEVQIGNEKLIFETGHLARQANGSVLLRCGDTAVFASACATPTASEEIDFFPLRVDYQERLSSAGRTAGGFLKREGRPSEREILICRLIDRPIRPMFEEGYYNEVQLLSYVFSYNGTHLPDVLAICATSAALAISDIPLIKPIGAVRVGMIDGKMVINPNIEEMKKSKLDLVLAGTEDAILMIEGYADFLTEEQVLHAIEEGHHAIQKICHCLTAWAKKIGKPKHRGSLRHLPADLVRAVENGASTLLESALRIGDKQEREKTVSKIKEELLKQLLTGETTTRMKNDITQAYKALQSKLMRKMILNDQRRIDGRALTEVRPIDITLSPLARTHGSVLFTRGETQALAVCTLGGQSSAQRFENLQGEDAQRFYLQYFFPPFSVGEVGRMGAPGRREVGHGKLAERSLMSILPTQEEFPYVIRIESNILESNGSSSMASVCGGCLALMDAGVPIRRPVAGIAMGLVLEGQEFAILSDILGTEDALGDMDFKVAGDADGITAFQMDIKVEGITIAIMKKALAQAKEGRTHILRTMLAVCPQSKQEMSEHAPRIETMKIRRNKIGTVIGPGGKQIRAIQEETGVEIDITEVDDYGIVHISSTNPAAMQRAKEIVFNLTAEVEIGKIYTGIVTSLMAFGLFVRIYDKEGLCHISEISHQRVQNIHDVPFREGDSIAVRVLDVDDRGKIRLSHKATLEETANTRG